MRIPITRIRISSQDLESGFQVRILSQDFKSGYRGRISSQNLGQNFKSRFRLKIPSLFDFFKNLEMQNCVLLTVEERCMTTQIRLHRRLKRKLVFIIPHSAKSCMKNIYICS